MNERLVSYAMLDVNYSVAKSDYIALLLPFVAECIRKAPQPVVATKSLSQSIADEFGLMVPEHVLKTVLRRAVHRGYVEQRDNAYFRCDVSLAEVDISSARADGMRKHRATITRFIDFCEKRFEGSVDPLEAERVLSTFLDHHSVRILAAAADGRGIDETTQGMTQCEIAAHQFVLHLSHEDPSGFEDLEAIVKGGMLANALYFSDISAADQQWNGTHVFFDTPFLLRALGVDGPSIATPCRELLRILHSQNAVLRCFHNTLDETYGVLRWMEKRISSHSHGDDERYLDVVDGAVEPQLGPGDLAVIAADLEAKLGALHIRDYELPPVPRHLSIDEDGLDQVLQRYVSYKRGETRRHDLEALAAIHRIRDGRKVHQWERCRAIFVTTNSRVVAACDDFFTTEYGADIPLCVLDHVFSTVAWLKTPLAAPNLPRDVIIADCYAALNPPRGLWRLYVARIEQLKSQGDITEHEYAILRFDPAARATLMELTRGDTRAFVEGTPEEVLRRAQAALLAEHEAKLRVEAAKRELAERRAAEADACRQRAEEDAQVRVQEGQAQALAAIEADRNRQLTVAQKRGLSYGKWARRVVTPIAGLLFAAGMYLMLPIAWPSMGEIWMRAAWAIVGTVSLLAFVDWFYGRSGKDLLDDLEVAVARFVEGRTKRMMGIPD